MVLITINVPQEIKVRLKGEANQSKFVSTLLSNHYKIIDEEIQEEKKDEENILKDLLRQTELKLQEVLIDKENLEREKKIQDKKDKQDWQKFTKEAKEMAKLRKLYDEYCNTVNVKERLDFDEWRALESTDK